MNARRPGEPPQLVFVLAPPLDMTAPSPRVALAVRTLRARGLDVHFEDANAAMFHRVDERIRSWWRLSAAHRWGSHAWPDRTVAHLDEHLDRVARELPAVRSGGGLVFWVDERSHFPAIELARRAKALQPGARVVFAGPGMASPGERNFVPDGVADVFVVGEPGPALAELFDPARRGLPVAGVISGYERHGARLSPRAPPRNLDAAPEARYEDFDLSLYQPETRAVPLGRGCARRCAFCAEHVPDVFHRSRLPSRVFREIRRLAAEGVTRVLLADLAVNSDPAVLGELADLLADAGLGVELRGRYLPGPESDADLLARMRRAGFTRLMHETRTGSDGLLAGMGQGFTAKDASRALVDAHEAGLENHVYFMVGFPGEGPSEFIETCAFLLDHRRVITEFDAGPARVPPGCAIAREPERFGVHLVIDDSVDCWHDGGYNNQPHRRKSTMELVVYADFIGVPLAQGARNLAAATPRHLRDAMRKRLADRVQRFRAGVPEPVSAAPGSTPRRQEQGA